MHMQFITPHGSFRTPEAAEPVSNEDFEAAVESMYRNMNQMNTIKVSVGNADGHEAVMILPKKILENSVLILHR